MRRSEARPAGSMRMTRTPCAESSSRSLVFFSRAFRRSRKIASAISAPLKPITGQAPMHHSPVLTALLTRRINAINLRSPAGPRLRCGVISASKWWSPTVGAGCMNRI